MSNYNPPFCDDVIPIPYHNISAGLANVVVKEAPGDKL